MIVAEFSMRLFVVHELVEGVFESAFIEADRDESALGIIVLFVLCHTPPVIERFDRSLQGYDGVSIA